MQPRRTVGGGVGWPTSSGTVSSVSMQGALRKGWGVGRLLLLLPCLVKGVSALGSGVRCQRCRGRINLWGTESLPSARVATHVHEPGQ